MNKLELNNVVFDYENGVRAIDSCCRDMYSRRKDVHCYCFVSLFKRVDNEASWWHNGRYTSIYGVRNASHYVDADFCVSNETLENVAKDFKQLTKAFYEQFAKHYDIKLGKTVITQVYDFGVNYAVKATFDCKTGGKIVVMIETNTMHERWDSDEDQKFGHMFIKVYFCHDKQFVDQHYDEIVQFNEQHNLAADAKVRGVITEDVEQYIDEVKQCIKH